jgi:hypothetical protein
MFTLDLPTAPYWIDLPRGVRVEVKPVTTAIMAAAQAAAARRLGALRAADPELDPDLAKGLAFALLCKGLARHSIVAWDGIGDAKGNPLPLTPEGAERLMDLDDMASSFWDAISCPLASVAVEGNV